MSLISLILFRIKQPPGQEFTAGHAGYGEQVSMVKGLGSAMGENSGKPDFGLLLRCVVMARGCSSCWPFWS